MTLCYADGDGVVHAYAVALVEGHDADEGRLGLRRPVAARA